MSKAKTRRFLGWYYPEGNEVLKKLQLNRKKCWFAICYYPSDGEHNIRRHTERKHALPNTEHFKKENVVHTCVNAHNLNGNEGNVYTDEEILYLERQKLVVGINI